MHKVNKKKIMNYTIFKIFPHYKILYIFHNFMLVFVILMEKEIEEKKNEKDSPVPFINLFFLLIFFYKRILNYLK
ncbi:hypothetical protein YYC_03287 [Plasmodium yoelii 17X]|uniref:Uncharacterized protein n=2 Tax=Plasmodium yoelii TaxID=5861 RepID=Q7RGB2_PLAYO|nr:hypothetical protein [Plasmodium yoelii yoelii]ETB59937.1 hypothetical protein YYC_03287 [Plasmodium yoelii 17X]